MKNKKIALISLCKGEVNSVPPLAFLYLATALKKNDYEVKIIHRSINDKDLVFNEVLEYDPVLIGMTVFTGYNNSVYVDISKNLSKRGYKIVWGNAHPTLLPKQALKEDFIDFVVLGEGEETIVELMDKINEPEKYKEIKGLGFKDRDGNIVINPKRDFINIDDYLIDWSLIDLKPYLRPYFSGRYKKVLVVTTSRGCPYNCQFCYNLVFNDRKWRAHSAEKFLENIKPIIDKYKIDAIRFLDDNFFVNKKRAFQILRELNLPYLAESRVEYVDEEFVNNLKETKCQEIMFGFESGSDRIMKEVIQKGSTKEDVVNAVKLLKNSGIMVSGSIVFGFPTETEEEYKMTMNFIVDLLKINPNLAFTSGWFLPFPGTGLYSKAIEQGFEPPEKIADWDKFDRWRNDYKMDWIDWDYQEVVKYSRDIVAMLAMSYKRNIFLFKDILTWRVKNANYKFPIDIYILSKIRSIYFSKNHKNVFIKLLSRFLKYLSCKSK